jgi:hypothetical protein
VIFAAPNFCERRKMFEFNDINSLDRERRYFCKFLFGAIVGYQGLAGKKIWKSRKHGLWAIQEPPSG